MNQDPVYVNLEFTPNPNTLKFSVNRPLLPAGAANFKKVDETENAPLAKSVFGVDGIQAVMVGTNFVTITKAPEGSWDTIADEVPKTIENFLAQDTPTFNDKWFEEQEKRRAESSSGDGEIETKVKEILDAEIRPAVAMDGGDITFERYENGTVYLHLQGACSSCPSSVMTLKMGVETRLKDSIPEIKEVVQV